MTQARYEEAENQVFQALTIFSRCVCSSSLSKESLTIEYSNNDVCCCKISKVTGAVSDFANTRSRKSMKVYEIQKRHCTGMHFKLHSCFPLVLHTSFDSCDDSAENNVEKSFGIVASSSDNRFKTCDLEYQFHKYI